MKLILKNNETYKEIMEVDIANTFFKRMKGLMFKKEILKGLIITPCNSIHTFFMKQNIDVIYVNKNNKIIKLTKCMKPWKIGLLIFNSKFVIELPEGTIKKMNIKLKDEVYFTM